MSCNQPNNVNLKPFEKDKQNPLEFLGWCSVPVPASVSVQSQTHPSVVYIPDTFMHSTVWLATTPYPKGNIAYENPCVYFNKSASYVHFFPIVANPIHARPSGPNAYNSDVDLIYSNHRLYSIIRECWNGKYAREIKVQSSSDGQHWSNATHVYSNLDTQGKDLLSPSVIQYNNQFYIYHLNGNSGNDPNAKCLGIEIMKGASLDQPDFTFYKSGRFINQDSLQIEPWHFDLFVYNHVLWMVFCAPDHSHGPTTKMFTYLAYSNNFIDFTIFKKPLVSDHATYRPTAFIDENGVFYLYFSILDSPEGDGRAIGVKKCDFESLLQYLNYYEDPLQL
ncbi:MAG: hypothetical protein ACP5F6_07770 [Microbacter sp.]